MARKITADDIHRRLRALENRANVSAYIVLNAKGDHVGTVRFHYPRDGAGRLTVMVADWSAVRPEGETFQTWTRWQIGTASGGGYDKHTAACYRLTVDGYRFRDEGKCWNNQLRDAGYTVLQAV